MRALLKWKVALLLAAASLASALWWLEQPEPLLDWRQGELVAILPADELDTAQAFELELATLFAQHLHVRLKPLFLPPHEVLPALEQRQAHFAASRLREGEHPELRYSESYQTVRELAVCRQRPLRRLEELPKRTLTVVAGSTQEAALLLLKQRIPEIHWHAVKNASQRELLQRLAQGELDCVLVNEEQLASARNFHPNLGSAFDLGTPSRMAWAFPPTPQDTLLDVAQGFFARIRNDGTLYRLIDHHYGHNERLEAVDAAAFITQVQTVLPHYRPLFEEAERLTGIDWRLLAALAYQESHWNPLATSYTNVRGMMMLTEDTADRMGVGNRLDARESILAGARYLLLLKEQLPARIKEQERIWMALAAYNQGMGHLEDARVLAKRSGLNPDVWVDVRKTLPLLSQDDYAAQAKHGHARGGEAVILVETVRLYYDMLKRLEPDAPAAQPPKQRLSRLMEKARNKLKAR